MIPIRAAAASALSLALALAPAESEPADGWRACEESVSRDPGALDGYRCHLVLARRSRDWDTAARRLESLRGREETRAGASLYLGWVEADRGRPGALALYEEAADAFARAGGLEGEIAARAAAVTEHGLRQNGEEAERQARRAWELAQASGRPAWMARALLARARAAIQRERISEAWSFARRAESHVREGDPADLRIELHQTLGGLCWMQERPEQAAAEYRKAFRLAELAGDGFEAAMLRYSLAFLAVNRSRAPAPGATEALEPMRRALSAARAAGNLAAELRCRLVLGQAGDAAARGHLRRAAELAGRLGDFERGLFATRFYAYTLDPSTPSARREMLESFSRALRLARSRGDLEHQILTQVGLATALWAMGERERSLEVAEQAFDAIELGRSLQGLGAVRAGWHSRFDFFYKRIAGWLLQAPPGAPVPADRVARSLNVMERLRGRVFLETLEAPPAAAGFDRRRLEALRGIAEIQRSLRDARLTEAERARELAELDRLEVAEAALRTGNAAPPDGVAAAGPAPRLTLEGVRRGLEPGEALVSFQLHERALRPGWTSDGGSWVVVLTRDRHAVRSLADEAEIEAAAFVYLGLLDRDDAVQRAAAARLYQLLFGDVLQELPSDVRSLVLVLDPLLEALPMGTLRAAPEAAPLAQRFELSRVPSIASFLHLRGRAWATHPVPALALADPSSDGSGLSRSRSIRAAFGEVADGLPPLPFARREARALQTSLGRGSVVRRGEAATESGLKATDLGRYAILHLGAHAIVDEGEPQRSAVVLAPGNASEDGLLQPRDIDALALDGQLVVLAACRTVTGQLVPSEGAMGLGRAFLARGARSVVASLWPIQDDLAADLFARFYRHLATGVTVGAALAAAQRELREARVPARGWAGVVVLGDSTLVPVAPPAAGRPATWLLALVLAGAVLAAARRAWRRSPDLHLHPNRG